MECRLSKTPAEQPWSCRISIRRSFKANGQQLEEVSETQFGPVLHSPDDVEPTLRRAQLAVLNETITEERLLAMSTHEVKQMGKTTKKFSRNVVCVTLAGPTLPNLSFIDLPGS